MSGTKFYDRIAPVYDLLMKAGAFLDGIQPSNARKNFIASLELHPAERVLEAGSGTGINLVLAAQQVGSPGLVVGLDHSLPMLEQGRRKIRRKMIPVCLLGGSTDYLPFEEDSFDTAFIFGAFNLLTDRKGALKELMRVTAPGGLIVISDKSLSAYHQKSFRKSVLRTLEPALQEPPPIYAFPLTEADVELSWEWNNLFYVIRFHNPKRPHQQVHEGSRLRESSNVSGE